jgi:6-phosphogluconolactonase
VLVANYTAGSTAVFPILPNGSLGAATDVKSPGTNAHLAITNPSGGFVFVPCLGSNFIAQYTFDATQGKLAPNAPATVSPPPASGPRHLAFHPNEKFAYGINETASTMSAYGFDVGTGRLTLIQTLSTIPSNFASPNTGAEVAMNPSGGFVYGSNRGHDSIVTFAVNAATGQLTLVGHEPTGGKTPRSFAVDPAGTFLFAANQASGTVSGFRLDPGTGKPVPLPGPANMVPSPTFVGAWRVP